MKYFNVAGKLLSEETTDVYKEETVDGPWGRN